MKKVLTVLMAVTMVVGFAAMASAQATGTCTTCEDDPGLIPMTCLTEQGSCYPTIMDYEGYGINKTTRVDCNDGSYCQFGAKGDKHRAILNICDCIPDPFDTIEAGDIMDIEMTIKVDKGAGPVEGDNGVYWASTFPGRVSVRTFNNANQICNLPCDEPIGDRAFEGPFEYVAANGDTVSSIATTTCNLAARDRIVTLKSASRTDGLGFEVVGEDADSSLSTWWIDIPEIAIDPSVAKEGYKIWVSICVSAERLSDNICADCNCCCEIYIGELTCDCNEPSTEGCSDTLIFPYFPKTAAYWYGMAVTNTSSVDGKVTVTLYENDGDIASVEVTIPANQTKIIPNDSLVMSSAATGSGVLGDAQSYAKAVTNFAASGFGMMAKISDGSSSMGYLAERCGNCGKCY